MSSNLLKSFASASLPFLSSALTVQSAVLLGNVTSTNTEDIRDLGFSGVVGDVALNSYGDTLICGDGSAEDRYYQTPPCNLLHANSGAYSEPDPRNITDFNLDANGNAQIWCGYSAEELSIAPESSYGMGITNVIAQPGSTTQGILYFLKNYRPGGHDQIVGGGVAIVDVTGAYPTCGRTSDHWWECTQGEPQYGDHGQLLAGDGYVYVYGGANATNYYDGVFLTRVLHTEQTDINSYEYWNGTGFQKERLHYPTEEQAVLGHGASRGTVTWNPYLQTYLFVYTCFAEVRARTAPNPRGPWPADDYTLLFNADEFAFCYSPSQQTRYDPSGKTLVISYTGYPNIIQAHKFEFA